MNATLLNCIASLMINGIASAPNDWKRADAPNEITGYVIAICAENVARSSYIADCSRDGVLIWRMAVPRNTSAFQQFPLPLVGGARFTCRADGNVWVYLSSKETK